MLPRYRCSLLAEKPTGIFGLEADRSTRKLMKLMNGAAGLMTVEVWSLASVASFLLKQTEEVAAELVDEEMEFLKSFARLVERICKDQYNRETEAVRS
jgi:hypothetical protein